MPPTDSDSFARLRRHTWMSQCVLPVLMFTGMAVLVARQPRPPALTVALVVVIAVATVVAVHWYVVAMRDHAGEPTVAQWGAWAAAAVLVTGAGIADSLAGESNYVWPMLAATLTSAVLMRAAVGRRVIITVIATGYSSAVIGALYLAGALSARQLYTAIVVMVSFTWALFMGYWNYEVAQKLQRARRVEADLAVARERLRFAAELHDIQGHHLQVIALKSELAARVGTRDPRAAVAHMSEVESLAREAQRDTRALVAGYRQVAVTTEIDNAARVLRAAGVDCRTSTPPGWSADAESERLLGLLIREATTNMLRHARPLRASFVLRDRDGTHVEVSNDGGEDAAGSPGTGLDSLRGRFTAAGGWLDWRHEAGTFTLSGGLPAGEEAA